MVLTKKTKDKLNPSRSFSWTGDPISMKGKRNYKELYKYYNGFQLDHMKIKIGDCVCISSASHTMFDFYVGRIMQCYDKGTERDNLWAHIQWYLHLEEIPKNRCKLIFEEYTNFDSTKELLKDDSSLYINDTDIESIAGTCCVTEIEESLDPFSIKKPQGHVGHFFISRFMYRRNKPWITPIKKKNISTVKEIEQMEEVKLSKDNDFQRKSYRRRTIALNDRAILNEIDENNCNINSKEIELTEKMKRIQLNKQNVFQRNSRRRTIALNDMAILNEIDEENSNDFNTELSNKFKGTESTLVSKRLNKENVPHKRERRKTTIFNDISIQKEINEQFSSNKKQQFKEVATEKQRNKTTPLKERLQIVEMKVSTLSLNSPKKEKLVKKTKTTSVSKDVKLERTKLSEKMEQLALPKRNVPIKCSGSKFECARIQLHVSSVPDCLPCREEEFQKIYSFVEGKVHDSIGGCLYVSGVPGTGKTATVNEVMNLLYEAQTDGSVPSFDLLHINAMKLTKPHQLWVEMWHKISGEKVTSDHAVKLLGKHLTKSNAKRKCVALILDELDLLWTKKQDVMYNLFDWSAQVGSKLIVVAIANTMDLPERMMLSRVSSRLGLTRMTFHPYNFNQLQVIITSRLSGMNAFEDDAIQFVSRKVSALSGDARRALDICRRATEIAEHSVAPKKSKNSPVKSTKAKVGIVGMEHVAKAIEEMYSSPMIKAISRCSKVEKMILQSIMSEFLRTGLEETVLENVLIQLESICILEGMKAPTSSQALLSIQGLSCQRIILAEHSRLDLMMRIQLNVSTDDISYALQEKT